MGAMTHIGPRDESRSITLPLCQVPGQGTVTEGCETARDTAEDNADKKKAKNMLKKIMKIMWGQEKQKIIIEDPSGNSAIISDRAEVGTLKVK